MSRSLRIILGLLLCGLAAAGAYLWATALMDSIYAYRSPLHAQPPAPGPELSGPLASRVVFVLIDALRLDTSLQADVMPVLDSLRQRGASATMHSRPPSYSAPSYSVLLTGAWPDLSDGPAMNLGYDEIPTLTQDNLVSAVARTGQNTAVSGYYWFERLIPQADVSDSFYTSGEDQVADRAVVDAALPWLREHPDGLVFIRLDQVDFAGHYEGGPIDARWDTAARRADALVGEILQELDLTRDVLFVCSDHGQIDRGGHGGQDAVTLLEPFVLAGAGVRAGQYGDVNMVDVAPTLAAILGANIPGSSQGRVLTELLTLSEDQHMVIQEALQTQQEQLLAAYQAAIGHTAAVQPDSDVVAAHQAALDAARAVRLRSERWPRAIVAIVVVVGLLALAIRLARRSLGWLLGGAALYAALFNARYALLDRRTYSLSSVHSANELILYCAVTALLAMLVAWLAVSLASDSFRKGTLSACARAVGLALVTIWLLLLPVMWSFAVNGPLASWTLPDMASMFLGFISLLQVLFVAVAGILTAALAALIGKLAAPKPDQ